MPDIPSLLAAIQADRHGTGPDSRAAAVALREASRQGVGLEEHHDTLTLICQQCSQVPILSPVSVALLIGCMRSGDLARLDNLIGRSKFRFGLRDALDDVLVAGLDPVPLLLATLRHVPDQARSLIGGFLKAHPEQVSRVLSAISADSVQREHLPRLMIELTLWQRTDATALIPFLVPFLDEKIPDRIRSDAARVARIAAEGMADLAPILPALTACLHDPSADVRRCAATALLLTEPEAFAALCVDADPDVRRGALFALGLRKDIAALGSALLSADPDTARLAERILRDLDTPAAPESVLRRLAEAHTPPASRYLRAIAQADPAQAQAICGWLPSGPLRDALERGGGMPLCSICRHLSRSKTTNRPSDFSPNLSLLTPPLAFGHSEQVSRCSECGWRYRYSWREDLRGLYPEAEHTLHRLSPVDPAYDEDRSAMLVRWRNDLNHLEPAPRIEAAWALTDWRQTQGDHAGLRVLLEHTEADVRRSTIRSLGSLTASLRTALKTCLSDPDDSVREAAAVRLASRNLATLLACEDPPLLRAGLKHIWLHKPAAVTAHAVHCIAALTSSDKTIRQAAAWALQKGLKEGHPADVRPVMSLLAHPLSDIRSRALTVLTAAVKHHGLDVSAHLPRIRELIAADETVYGASRLAAAAAGRGVDVRLLVDRVEANIIAGRVLNESFSVLRAGLAADGEHGPFIAALAAGLQGTWASTAASQLLAVAQRQDVSAGMSAIRAGLSSDDTFTRDQCARMVLRQALRDGDWDALRSLLSQQPDDIRTAAISELANSEAAAEPVAEEIAAFLSSDAGWIRRYAARALLVIPNRARVLAAVANQPDSPEKLTVHQAE